jgi:hypothetical protein
MREDERVWAVKELLFHNVKSPSLRHIRDPYSVSRLAQSIVSRIDRENAIWQKWDGQRELLIKSAAGSWVPVEDLRNFLNSMPGPKLTTTDVAQRLRAFEDEDLVYPKDELKPGCLALYAREKTEGTELPAILGALQEFVELEEERLRVEREADFQRRREQEQTAREQRLLSGADCKWTQNRKSSLWYCRANARTHRLSPTPDKMWRLHRVHSVNDDEKGAEIGKYRRRGDATKVVAQIAYQPELLW